MTRRFLEQIFSTCSGGVVTFLAFPRVARAWAAPGEWRAVGRFVTEAVRAGQNVSFGPATRKDTTDGTGANLYELPVLVADIDCAPEKAYRRLEHFPFRPSYVISSGQNVHALWRSKEPIDLTQPPERTRAISVQRRLCAHLQGDMQATDLTHVFRLPGTYSFKYGSPVPVAVLDEQPTTVNVGELDDFLPREVVYQNRIVSEACVTEGRRNDALYTTARSLRFRGLPWRVIVRAIETINAEWCRPPLDAAELSTMLKYALVQSDRPDFVARHTGGNLVHDAPPHGGRA